MYLDVALMDSTLAFISNHLAPRSTIVFDYICEMYLPFKSSPLMIVGYKQVCGWRSIIDKF
jgi:O-methyltransferase involved in polyketide biosynthesis